ncbi:hypothetical protein WDW86_18340 [Bdellovibrionota bacterium FG-2]
MRPFLVGTIICLTAVMGSPFYAHSEDSTVYSVFRGLDLGNAGEAPQKDYYVSAGTVSGVHEGTVLEVFRKNTTYDTLTEKLYREVTFPIATLKVIHAESHVAIARLEKMLPQEKSPAISPVAVMLGDIVRIAR